MLEIAKIVELAKEHATPMYLFDLDELQSRVQAMKEILGDEFDDFLKSYDEPKTTGLRLNTMNLNILILSMRCVHRENLQSVKESRSQWLILYFRVSIKKKQIFFM